MWWTKENSEIFYNYALGVGAIGGGFFGVSKSMALWIASKLKKKTAKEIREIYPRINLNKTFKLVDHQRAPGMIYLVDLKRGEKYWIQSGPTYLELGFSWNDFQRITNEEFDSYKEGPPILTSGVPWS